MAKKPGTVSAQDAHLGYWLRYVSNHVHHAFSLKAAAYDVTVAEWSVLRALYEQDTMAPSVLAERLGMTRGAISKLADRLLEKSLITRTASLDDRRYQSLALTAAGRTLLPKIAALADRNDEEFFGHMKAAERDAIKNAMREIVRRRALKTVPVE